MRALILAAVLAAVAGGARAADQAQIDHGAQAFQYSCAPCHGKGRNERGGALPGTEALAVKYKGERPPALEDRTDLTPEVVKLAVRRGIEGMPFFRRTELSNPDLDAICAYLSRNLK